MAGYSQVQTAFGEQFDQTIVMEVEFTALTDLKLRLSEKVTMEVEVGVAGKYEHFKSIGGRGVYSSPIRPLRRRSR